MDEMDDVQLGSIVSGEITDALNHFDSERNKDCLRALDFYLGEPLGNGGGSIRCRRHRTGGYSRSHHA